jgi:hypothetical protein
MIALQSDCLIFQLTNGESIPCSAEMITIEIAGNSEGLIAPDVLHHAASSVFHYFKVELSREMVTVGEFAQALEKALQGLGLTLFAEKLEPRAPEATDSDLGRIAQESDESLELFFYQRLRKEFRARLQEAPRVMRFHGLRGCAKQLAGAQRWSARCEKVQEQIVGYLRECLVAEQEQKDCALMVD